MFGGALATGILGRARERKLVRVALHQLRDYAQGSHLAVDDTPYGGGPGMVMKPEPLIEAIEHIRAPGGVRTILLAAQGPPFTQRGAQALASEENLLLVCGRYEGVDARVSAHVDEALSIGDYVLTGGELAALVVIDAIVRLLPGALGNVVSPVDESFATGLLEHPQYTRPPTFRGVSVPDVLLSGDHAAIARWHRQEALRTTLAVRPDLLVRATLDEDDRRFLRTLGWRDG